MRKIRRPSCITILAVLMTSYAFAQTAPRTADGIAVGEPKLYDNRSLALMLENLQHSLSLANGAAVDAKSLNDSLLYLQGYQQNDVSRAVDVSLSGATNAATVPAAPASTVPAVSNKVGINAEDLLSDQVTLTYQIVNLQMLLERAESDRYWQGKTETDHGARMQVVLGFQISLNPPPKFRGCAAVVLITVSPDSTSVNPGDMSLVALMPEEKTYNAATLSTHSNSFSGAAVVKIVTVGYSEAHRGSNLYMYKDSDTVAFEEPAGGGSATFGWQFRPVLGRPAVDAGVRQLFAVLALPNTDLSGANATPKVKISAKTYWVKYNSKRRVADSKQIGVKSGGYADRPMTAYSGSFINTKLSPTIHAVTWNPIGPDAALVDVQGDNLFDGSSVLLNGAIIDRTSAALNLNSDQHLQLRTTISALAHSEGVISGRYGNPTALRMGNYLTESELTKQSLPSTAKVLRGWCLEKPDMLGYGIDIGGVRAHTDPGRNLTSLEIDVVSRQNHAKAPPDLCDHRPLITVGDQTMQVGWYVYPSEIVVSDLNDQRKPEQVITPSLRYVVQVANEALAKEQPISFKVPFLGDTYEAQASVYRTSTANKVVQTFEGESTTLAITGVGFDKNTVIYADKPYEQGDSEVTLLGPTAMLLKLQKDKIKGLKQLIVVNPKQDPVFLALTTAPAEKPAKASVAKQNLIAVQDSAVGLTISGDNLKSAIKVTFEGKSLDVIKADDGKSITVFLTRDVTRLAGTTVDLLVYADADTALPVTVQIVKNLPPASSK